MPRKTNQMSCEFQELRTERRKKKDKRPTTSMNRLGVPSEPEAFSLPSLKISCALCWHIQGKLLSRRQQIFDHFPPISHDFWPNCHRNFPCDPHSEVYRLGTVVWGFWSNIFLQPCKSFEFRWRVMTGFASFAEEEHLVLRRYRGIKSSIYSKPLSKFKAYRRYISTEWNFGPKSFPQVFRHSWSAREKKIVLFLYANEIVELLNGTPSHHRGLSHARQASTCLTENFAFDLCNFRCTVVHANRCNQFTHGHTIQCQ